MPAEAFAALRVFLWELGLGCFCWAIVRPLSNPAERLLYFLSLNITAAALIATGLSFLGLNSLLSYLASAFLLLAMGLVTLRLRPSPPAAHSPQRGLLLLVPFLFLLICCFRPVVEVDSLYNLHFLLGWLDNRTNPYDFAFHYVPFWELSVFPVLALSRSDLFFWVDTLKATSLVGVGLWLIADEFGLSPRLRWAAVTSCLLFPFLWFPPAGVASLKNDGIHAAGEIMFALALLRAASRKGTRLDKFLLTFACIFLSVKFSGPIFLLASLLLAAFLAPSAVWRSRNLLGFAALSWLLTVGHYYAHNLLRYGNPFYPFQINAPGIHLPGLGDLSSTSILFSLHDPRLWKAFFLPQEGLSPAGLFFPLLLPVILLGSLAACMRGISDRIRALEWLTPTFVFALFQLLVWGLYFRSVYSASGQPGDLQFVLGGLNSIRYVQGALLATTVFVAARLPIPEMARIALLALQGASFLYLLFKDQHGLAVSWIVLAGLLASALASYAIFRRSRSITVALFAMLLVFSIQLGIPQRRAWLPDWQPVWGPFWESAPHTLYVVIDGENSEQAIIHFPVAGRWLQNRVRGGSFQQIGAAGRKPEFIVRLKRPDPAIDAAGMADSAYALEGYRKIWEDARAAVWSRVAPGLPAPALKPSGTTPSS